MNRIFARLRGLFGFAPARPEFAAHPPEHDNEDDTTIPDVVRIEIRDSIDLHSFPPRDIPAIVREYLIEAHAHGFPLVRIIHGKGTGTQRAVVRRILAQTDFVIDYADAAPHAGGWGATIARLDLTAAATTQNTDAESAGSP